MAGNMAFTLAHPAAVLPLRKLRHLALLPMIVGTLMPDLVGYLPFNIEYRLAYGHTPAGTLLTDVPAGYLLLLVLLLFRRSLVLPLWEPHRTLIAESLDGFFSRPHRWLVALPSLLLGSWTHILWDRLTHATPWTYRNFPLLYQPLFPDSGHALHLYHVLQYVTSAIGLACMAWSYWQHLQGRRAGNEQPAAGPRNAWLLALLLATALLVGAGRMVSAPVEVLSVYARLSLFLKTAIVIFALQYFASGLILMRYAHPESRHTPRTETGLQP